MYNEQELKERLQEIADNDFKVPPRPELYPLVLTMGTHLGSTDPVLRDDLIYTTLATWIWRDDFRPSDLNEILKVALNEQHLFLGLGDVESDTVFMRSFSMLIVAAILNSHVRHPFLPDQELFVIKSKILRYITKENDLRGFVPGKGWAHAVAHTADAFEELLQCQALSRADLLEILEALRPVTLCKQSVYICEEDERLASAVLSAWQREEITEEDIINWLQPFNSAADSRLSQPEGYRQFVNAKNFLRSLYFRSHKIDFSKSVKNSITEAMTLYNRF